MAGWFDNYARKSAQRADNAHVGRASSGVSRRRFVVGGSAAVATAWTAPMLMASSAAAVGLSACTTVVCNGECCPPGSVCEAGVGGVLACKGTVGGACRNAGTGQGGCFDETVHCNGNAKSPDQCNYCKDQPFCGGEGTTCSPTATQGDPNHDCAQVPTIGFLQTCSNSDPYPANSTTYYCRLRCVPGAVGDTFCQVNGDATATGDKQRFCHADASSPTGGFCAAHCASNGDCMAPGHCLNPHSGPGTNNSICLYSASA